MNKEYITRFSAFAFYVGAALSYINGIEWAMWVYNLSFLFVILPIVLVNLLGICVMYVGFDAVAEQGLQKMLETNVKDFKKQSEKIYERWNDMFILCQLCLSMICAYSGHYFMSTVLFLLVVFNALSTSLARSIYCKFLRVWNKIAEK